MAAKDKHRINLLKYLGDPENDFPTARQDYADILGLAIPTLYNHFSPQDFLDIEAEAYDLRKKHSSKQRAELLKTLYNEGKSGNVPAIKEFLDRTEGKVPNQTQITGKDGGAMQHEHKLTIPQAIEELKKKGIPVPDFGDTE